MAMRLQVDVGRGQKEIISVTPNTTMQFVLDEVCQRRKLDATVHTLKHKKTVLESSLTVRFSGLSSNAMLELVAAPSAKAQHGSCTIALQMEDGTRKTFSTDTSTLLSQVAAQHIGLRVRAYPGSLRHARTALRVPCYAYRHLTGLVFVPGDRRARATAAERDAPQHRVHRPRDRPGGAHLHLDPRAGRPARQLGSPPSLVCRSRGDACCSGRDTFCAGASS